MQTEEMRELPRGQLQLVGATAMFIACKYEEIFYPMLSDLTYITANTYTEQEIIEMEVRMLKVLGYSLGAPSSLQFLRRYSRMAEVSEKGLKHVFQPL